MESWSYIPEERSYMFSDEVDFSLDDFMRGRKPLVEWENKSSCNFEKDGFGSDKEVVKSMEFVDLGFPDFLHKSFHGSKPLETTSSCELDSNCSKRENSSTHVIALDSSFREEESESKQLSSLVESKTNDSSLIDLKLGRLPDCKGSTSGKDARGLPLTPTHPTTPAKRARATSSPAQAPLCQVYGCNMDLSSSKDYHKRHKVCDIHSKTAKVIVNGIEQRFCQQCSSDVPQSSRKSRIIEQTISHRSPSYKFHLLSAFDDGKRSCRRRLAGHNERRRKPQFDYITSKEHKILQSYQGAKYLESSLQNIPQFSFQDIFQSGILFPEKHDQISHTGHIKVEQKLVFSPQLTATDALDHELSNCALSLLSAQSQNPSRHATGIPLADSLIFQEERDNQVSEIPLKINSKEVSTHRSATLSDAGRDPQVHGDGICQTPESFDIKYREHGATVDLFQLSSNLQRVEQQRNSVLVKWENEECCFPTA